MRIIKTIYILEEIELKTFIIYLEKYFNLVYE